MYQKFPKYENQKQRTINSTNNEIMRDHKNYLLEDKPNYDKVVALKPIDKALSNPETI